MHSRTCDRGACKRREIRGLPPTQAEEIIRIFVSKTGRSCLPLPFPGAQISTFSTFIFQRIQNGFYRKLRRRPACSNSLESRLTGAKLRTFDEQHHVPPFVTPPSLVGRANRRAAAFLHS